MILNLYLIHAAKILMQKTGLFDFSFFFISSTECKSKTKIKLTASVNYKQKFLPGIQTPATILNYCWTNLRI